MSVNIAFLGREALFKFFTTPEDRLDHVLQWSTASYRRAHMPCSDTPAPLPQLPMLNTVGTSLDVRLYLFTVHCLQV